MTCSFGFEPATATARDTSARSLPRLFGASGWRASPKPTPRLLGNICGQSVDTVLTGALYKPPPDAFRSVVRAADYWHL